MLTQISLVHNSASYYSKVNVRSYKSVIFQYDVCSGFEDTEWVDNERWFSFSKLSNQFECCIRATKASSGTWTVNVDFDENVNVWKSAYPPMFKCYATIDLKWISIMGFALNIVFNRNISSFEIVLFLKRPLLIN